MHFYRVYNKQSLTIILSNFIFKLVIDTNDTYYTFVYPQAYHKNSFITLYVLLNHYITN
jgi:hypothetical protein